ncbi:hypothetical protein GALMADRAFT_916727 [Galerina marginata CBS 339.88]|uniref:Uncharacterized protein n=1 Tax=Galerina marginata (strain CBS 339.88) TaxID=685588 RepID=A0A067SHV6_GALM3|nr:hypothetical protein GALMADRAFT_916727 [Galerina marginata CBS 339.88]
MAAALVVGLESPPPPFLPRPSSSPCRVRSSHPAPASPASLSSFLPPLAPFRPNVVSNTTHGCCRVSLKLGLDGRPSRTDPLQGDSRYPPSTPAPARAVLLLVINTLLLPDGLLHCRSDS